MLAFLVVRARGETYRIPLARGPVGELIYPEIGHTVYLQGGETVKVVDITWHMEENEILVFVEHPRTKILRGGIGGTRRSIGVELKGNNA